MVKIKFEIVTKNKTPQKRKRGFKPNIKKKSKIEIKIKSLMNKESLMNKMKIVLFFQKKKTILQKSDI